MKREELYRRRFRSENEFRNVVDDYMEFHNNIRPHSTLKNKTPEQVESAFAYSQGISRD